MTTPATARGLPDVDTSVPAIDEGIQGLRGLAILLLVAVHSSRALRGTGELDLVAEVNDAFLFVRMPLFAAISGWVFALRPPGPRGLVAFVRRRARRLLLPQLAYGLVVLLVGVFPPRLVWPDSWTTVVAVLGQPRAHLWFVQALFLILLLALALEAADGLRTPLRWVAVTAVALLAPTLLPADLPRSGRLGGVAFLLGYFLLGLGLQRFGERIFTRAVVAPAVVVFLMGVVLQQLVGLGIVELERERGSMLSLLVGVPAVSLLLRHRAAVRLLAWLGPYSFAIFLYHRDGITLGLRALQRASEPFGTAGSWLLVLGGAVGLPILAHAVLVRLRPTRRLFLGLP